MRYAQIGAGGVVINVVRARAAWIAAQPGQWVDIGRHRAGIGWTWDGAAFAPPPEPTDAERAATIKLRRSVFLLAVDGLLDLGNAPGQPDPADHIAAAIQASGGALGPAKRQALILIRSASEFWRDDPDAPGLMDAVGGLLGLTPAQIDALFLNAAEGRADG